MKPFLPLATLILAGCAALPQKPPNLTGEWGGQGVGLVLEGGLGQLRYDCAAGTIDKPVVPGPDGQFVSEGTHRAGQGGPIRVGQIFQSQRAQYRGRVDGKQMTLSVALEDGSRLGPFLLESGAQPLIRACL